MKLGTKSLLWGAHQFILHPIFVFIAWRKFYRPNPTDKGITRKPPGLAGRILASIVHDWGYWGCPTMDGPCGDQHSVWGANLVYRLTRSQWWYEEVLCHSRFFAKRMGMIPSNFCWVDKWATASMPSCLWATLAWLSGEGYEYLENPMYEIHVPGEARTWTNLRRFHERLRDWTRTTLNRYGWEVE